MSERAAPDWLTDWEYAHRGLHGCTIPENTLAGAEAAIAASMGIECDIQMSRDGVPMVFHDWDLERLIGGNGRVADRSAVELSEMSISGTDQRLATLSQFLDLVDGRVPVLIEVKSNGRLELDEVCGAILDALSDYTGLFAIMSFDHWITRWLHENAPEVPCGLVMREDEYGNTQTQEEREFAFRKAQPDFLAYHIAALPSDWVESLREGGLPILTWTVNSPGSRRRALDCADALIAEGEGLA